MWSIVAPSQGPSPLTQMTEDGIALHEKVRSMPTLPMGPFARRPDGAVIAIEGDRVVTSIDEGLTWETLTEKPFGAEADISVESAIIHIPKGRYEGDEPIGDHGVLILAWED